jgi:cell division control protein 7
VYKAIDINYDLYKKNWDASWKDTCKWASQPIKKKKEGGEAKRPVKVVALKRIYVTSSPTRILNELELLHHLR